MPRLDGTTTTGERRSPRHHITREEADAGLEIAATLIKLGAPVGLARPARNRASLDWDPTWGTGNSGYWVRRGWETTPATLGALDRYDYGDALFMVTGHTFDVIDIDPRNGGNTSRAELLRLGVIPEVYARALTPSGGEHLFIASTGERKTNRGGIDLQAGDAEGNGRGFVWIAPTVRRSKTDGTVHPYLFTEAPEEQRVVVPDDSVGALLGWFREPTTTPSSARTRAHRQPAAYDGDAETWLSEHTTGKTLSRTVTRAIQPFLSGEPFTGHERMLKFQTHLVRCAAEGHNGVPEALAFARQVWLASPHGSGEDPAVEWDTALDHVIKKFGGTNA